MNLDAIVAALRADFAEAGDPARAAAMRAYMKERFPFFGIPAGARRKGQRAFWNRTAGGRRIGRPCCRSFGGSGASRSGSFNTRRWIGWIGGRDT